jgi:hypothetical protein
LVDCHWYIDNRLEETVHQQNIFHTASVFFHVLWKLLGV